MRQQVFHFAPLEESPISKMDTKLCFMGLDSIYFDFAGIVNKERRKGQFQYRWGRKIQPKDWRIKHDTKRTTTKRTSN